MSELFIDPIVFDAVEGRPLPGDHRAKRFADGLPEGHPIKRLFAGESQWLGDDKNVYGFLRLFHEIYEDRLTSDAALRHYRAAPPPLPHDVANAADALERDFPHDVIYRGRRYCLLTLLANAREAIEVRTREMPPLRAIGLDAFHRTLARLVRAVRLS